MGRPRKIRHVAIALSFGVPHYERSMRGILRYAKESGHWSVAVTPDFPSMSFSDLAGWKGDGAVVLIEDRRDARLAKKLAIPMVDISGTLADTGIPRVTSDNRAIGRMAAHHLLDCGFRHFAYYGVRGFWYSEQRGLGFEEAVKAAGGAYSLFLANRARRAHATWGEVDQLLCNWLKSLNTPVGVFACHDYRARLILDACVQCGLRVPEELALLGVNNDAVACEFCQPSLSSISRNAEEVGYQAAAMLDRLMAGKAPPQADVLVPPDGVVRRHSTDVIAVDDAEVEAAVRSMYQHLSKPLRIQDLARQQGISRRWLEHAFRSKLGQTPHQYLNFLRIRRARELLLRQPKPRVLEVARECGFSDTKRFRLAFIRIVGVGPAEYRKLAQEANATSHSE